MAGRLSSSSVDRFRLVQNSDINVTPFVDVMMVLLIVFMVALPVATTSLKLDLPPAGKATTAVEPTYISLQRGGALFIGDRPTTLASLPADLGRIIGGSKPTAERVYVRADKGVRYGDFMRVVSRLHAGGYKAVGLVNEVI